LSSAPLAIVLLLLAVVPALCEEFFFRGFVLSGLSTGLRKWPVIVATGAIFGVYHFMIERIPVTATLGIVLALVCWQSRSIFPGMLAHLMHNSALMVIASLPRLQQLLHLSDVGDTQHLPARVLLPALVLFAAGLVIAASMRWRDPAAGGPPFQRVNEMHS